MNNPKKSQSSYVLLTDITVTMPSKTNNLPLYVHVNYTFFYFNITSVEPFKGIVGPDI